MPNWCTNELIVSGKAKDLAVFKAQAHRPGGDNVAELGFCISRFIPIPEELVGTRSPVVKPNPKLTKKYGADNWYDWCCNNWGTKWDVEGQEAGVSKGKLGYTFDSAWAPPSQAIERISEMYLTLKFVLHFVGEGNEFSGTEQFVAGERTEL
jgi:hypothetical protein